MKKLFKVVAIILIALAACYGIYCLVEKFLLKYKNYDESELEGEENKYGVAALIEKVKNGYKEEIAKLKKAPVEEAEAVVEAAPDAADFAEA